MIWPQRQMLLQRLGPFGNLKWGMCVLCVFLGQISRKQFQIWIAERLSNPCEFYLKTDSPRGPRDSWAPGKPGWPSGLQRLGNESQKPSNLQTCAAAVSLSEIAFCTSLGWHWSWWHELEASKLCGTWCFGPHNDPLQALRQQQKEAREIRSWIWCLQPILEMIFSIDFIWSYQIRWPCVDYTLHLVSTWGSHQDGILSHTAVAQARTWKYVKVKETCWTQISCKWRKVGEWGIQESICFVKDFHLFAWTMKKKTSIQSSNNEGERRCRESLGWAFLPCNAFMRLITSEWLPGSRIRTPAVLAETRFPAGGIWWVFSQQSLEVCESMELGNKGIDESCFLGIMKLDFWNSIRFKSFWLLKSHLRCPERILHLRTLESWNLVFPCNILDEEVNGHESHVDDLLFHFSVVICFFNFRCLPGVASCLEHRYSLSSCIVDVDFQLDVCWGCSEYGRYFTGFAIQEVGFTGIQEWTKMVTTLMRCSLFCG